MLLPLAIKSRHVIMHLYCGSLCQETRQHLLGFVLSADAVRRYSDQHRRCWPSSQSRIRLRPKPRAMSYDDASFFSPYDGEQPCAMLMYGGAAALSLSLRWRAFTLSSTRPHMSNLAHATIAPLSAEVQRLWCSKDFNMLTGPNDAHRAVAIGLGCGR